MSQNFTILVKFLSVSRSIRLIVSKWASSTEFCRNDVSIAQAIAIYNITYFDKLKMENDQDLQSLREKRPNNEEY